MPRLPLRYLREADGLRCYDRSLGARLDIRTEMTADSGVEGVFPGRDGLWVTCLRDDNIGYDDRIGVVECKDVPVREHVLGVGYEPSTLLL